jgi:hypothetical protein
MGPLLNRRSLNLAGEPTWVRSGIQIWDHASTLTAHDWIKIIQSAGDYILADAHPDPLFMDAIYSLLEVCNSCLTATSAHGSENREIMDLLKLQTTEALAKCENTFPSTEMAVILHELVHVADCIYKWNSIRNFWSFFGER